MTKITNKMKIFLKSMLSMQFGEVNTDKGTLVFDGETLAVGDEVFTMGENEEPVPAADGDYTLENGNVIKVSEGKVAEIVEPAAEEPEATEEPATTEETFEEPAEPAAEPAEEPETEDEPETDRVAALETKVAELTEGIQAVLNTVATMEGKIAELEDKLNKALAEPAEEPAEEPTVEAETKMSRLAYLRK